MSLFRTKKELDKHVRTTLAKLRTDNEKCLRGVTISRLYYKLGEFSSALQYVSSYLQVKNDSAQAYRLQGECYEKLNKIDKALKAYQQSLHLEPKQFDLLKQICKLILANDDILSSGQAQFWCDFAAAQNCQDESVLNLRLKVMNRNNVDPKQVQDVILGEIMARPTDVSLRIRLVNHYLDQNRVPDAFRYTYDIEMKQNEFFAQSIDWYNTISSVLAKCSTEQKTKWPFWLLSIMALERQCFLKLCTAEIMKQQQILNLTECANLLFEFDQTLSAASSIVLTLCSERELAAQFLHHYRGQLCLHAATFLFKRDRMQQAQNRDSTINALALLLVAYNCGIASNDEPWLRNSNESTRHLIRLWSQQGAFRCSQAGRTLLSCIDDDKQNNSVMANIRKICTDWTTSEELVNQLRRASSSSDWRKNLFRMLFNNRDHAGKSTSSHLLNCTEMDDLNYELPKVSDLDTYEECAQWLRPSSLAQMVYLYIGASNLSDLTCQTFNGLNLSTSNLLHCGAETLNQLDVDTFLYATTVQAKRKLEIERSATESVNKGTNFIKPKILPYANIASMLATEEQANWWLSAYKVCKNISGDDLAEVRQQLQYGIEAVRGVGGPKMDVIICLKLGQIFLKRSHASSKVVEQGFLEARTLALFKFSLHMIKMQNSRNIDSRLFKYANGQDAEIEKQVDNLAEEAITHLASHYFQSNGYEECIDELSNIPLPSATYFIAKAYRRMEELNQTPKKNQRIYSDKATDYLQQTLTLLNHPNVDQKHPLRGIVNSDIRKLQQQHSSSFNGSFTNGGTYGGDTSHSETFYDRHRRDVTPSIDDKRIDKMEKLITQMMETLTVRFDRVDDKIGQLEDKISQIEDQINKKNDVNVDTVGLDDIIDEELQAQNFMGNSTMFPNYGQQRIHTPNQMIPGVAQQPILNPYGNQYYNNMYQMGMNQYQASLMTPQRTPLLMAQQNTYADVMYNAQLTDPRNNLHNLLTQQQTVQSQSATMPSQQTSAVTTMPITIQAVPPQQITPVLPTLPVAANTSSDQSQQNVVRTWNSSFNNTPIEKGPPVNVVITNSEPLPSLQTTTVTSQPALSVTIPSIHIKNTVASEPPEVSFTISPKPSQVATTAAQPKIDFSKKEAVKTNPLSSTPILGVTDKAKDTKTSKPSPFANFSFGNLSSNTTGGTSNIFGSLVKPAEAIAPKPVLTADTKTETSVANTSGTKDDEDEYVPTAEFTPLIALPDLIEVKTGEEEELVKFEHRAKLLRFVKESKEWKERGVGNMKVLVNKNDPNKVRLLMRREQVFKVCCNQFITKDTKFTKLPKLDTALSWYGQDFSENELSNELLAVRFKTAETCTEFHNAILEAQKSINGDKENEEATKSIQSKSAVEETKETTTKQGFGDQFKPVVGSWNCESCYVSNNSSNVKCVACNAPKDKPAAKEASAPVQAKAEAGKVGNGFGDKFKPQAGSWECKLCYISNKASDIYCAACESPKDDTVPKKEPKNLLSSLSSSSTPKFSFGVPATAPIANNNTASLTNASTTSASPFSFGAFTAMTTNNVTSSPAFGTTLGQPTPGGFTFGSTGLNAKSPFEVTPSKDSGTKNDSTLHLSTKLEQKENFSFVFKPKSPGKVKSPLKADGVEDISDDENVEEEENNTYFTPVIPLPDKVEVKTGEEDEEVLYSHRAKLFRFAEGEWKERGLGDVKILRHKGNNKLRVVMRREQILKICLNHALNEDVEYNVKDDKSWHFIVNDFSEGEVELMQFCLRFKTPEIAQEFRQAVRDALGGNPISQTSNGIVSDDNLTQEEKTNISQLKLPSGFYSHKTDCTGCRGCSADDFVFDNNKDINSDINDDNPLPLKQPTKHFSKTPGKPALTTFGQLSKTSEASRNIFGSVNSNPAGQGLFTQLSFTPNTKETTSIFGSSNIFGGNKSTTFQTTNDEPKITTSADEVKKNFSFTNTLKPSVFGQNIFGQAAATAPTLNATFGTTPIKTTDSTGAANSFSFGEALRTSSANSQSTTTPAASLFSFGTSLFGSSLNATNNFSSTKFSFASPSTSNNNADLTAPMRDNGLSFAALAKSNESGTVTSISNTESPFKIDSSLSFASLASQSTPAFNASTTQGDSKQGFFGLSNENAFSNFQKSVATANDSKDDSNVEDASYDPHYDPIIPLPDEIVVRTGEEDEEKLFGERAKLYRYDATNKEWKERGVGEFKILYHPANDTYRFLLRREQIFKCVLNHQLSAELCVNAMKSSEKAFVWAAHNHGEDSNGDLEQLSVRFKNPEIATKFIGVVGTCINKLKAKGDGLEPEDD
ncbi:hypothetical protein HA402_009719 [Bradysia odoriphaga]|nr:hypothetical protein HA402_009719 [Bradysia odoriphaga]